jgi:hypothetical protein
MVQSIPKWDSGAKIFYFWAVFDDSAADCTIVRLEEIVSTRLPQLPGFEVINVMSEDFESSLDTNSCFYSRNYYSMGSSLPEDIAVATYRQGLEDMGWQNWIVADSFRYGESAQVSISPWRISNVFLRPLVTDEVVPKYQSIIVITVSYLFC